MAPSPKASIAIVVGDPDLHDEIVRHFEPSHEVVSSLGDPSTIRLLREAAPGAIVVDLDLETLDPFELMRLVGGSPELRAAPLLVLSSRNDFDTFEKVRQDATGR